MNLDGRIEVLTVKNEYIFGIDILIMGSSFQIPFVITVMIWQCCVLTLVILLLSLLITAVLYRAANFCDHNVFLEKVCVS